ncbi:TrbC/VirB2 family protein [Alkalibacterium sp. 20]|uniref:TrbC/VirB2 family protein n=1 Tax=Alkalibacterium sp. 20 TaxID=1798803 RepID=UPI0008FFE81D|nr:TrbC/VirB2 family protein [Alkalibacterium sp. 20]OJF96187.1 hypothetical protein AX762_05490 [Alkalibacterium sp. 20]
MIKENLMAIKTTAEQEVFNLYANNLENNLNSATGDILSILQGVGVGVIAIFVVIIGYKIITGGREGLREAKSSVMGLIIGAILLFGALAVSEWLKTTASF